MRRAIASVARVYQNADDPRHEAREIVTLGSARYERKRCRYSGRFAQSPRALETEQNLDPRAKDALYKDPLLRSSPLQGEGKNGEPAHATLFYNGSGPIFPA